MTLNTFKLSETPQYNINVPDNTQLSFFGWLKSFSIVSWIIIIVILSLLGFNVFLYLAKGVNSFEYILKSLNDLINSGKLEQDIPTETDNANNNSLPNEHVKSIQKNNIDLDQTQVTINRPPNEIVEANNYHTQLEANRIQSNEQKKQVVNSSVPYDYKNNNNEIDDNSLQYGNDKATLNIALNSTQEQPPLQYGDEYEAHEAKSSFQENKAGWCFIGEDSGGRSCSNVGLNDVCMSGEIFPSKDVCINPKLRM